MEPSTYTDEILDREFMQLTADHVSGPFYVGVRFHHIPLKFTLRDARDGIKFPHKAYQDPIKFSLPKSQLEKLRRLKPGQVVAMTGSYRGHNNWYVALVNQELEKKIAKLEQDLINVRGDLDNIAGALVREERRLAKELTHTKTFITNNLKIK